VIGLLGKWENNTPVGGLSYYVSPPQSILDLKRDPIHVVFYCIFLLLCCAFFSRIWIEVSGTSGKDVAR